MNRLPKYWIVENDFSQRYKDTVIKKINEIDNTGGEEWKGDIFKYYGYDGGIKYNGCYASSGIRQFINNPTLLTLDEFIELSKTIDEFVLPEKWCVKCTKENYSVLDKWFFNKTGKHRIDPSHRSYWHYPENIGGNSTSIEVWYDYKEITFEQFQKYVLKLKDMEKKIMGYKLKDSCLQYFDAVDTIVGEFGNREQITIEGYPVVIKRLEEAGVLDLWFEPIYEQEYPDIIINGHKGEFFNDYVKFGCAEIDKYVFIRLGQLGQGLNHCNRVLESVTIGAGTFTKEQIKQIAGYYINKK